MPTTDINESIVSRANEPLVDVNINSWREAKYRYCAETGSNKDREDAGNETVAGIMELFHVAYNSIINGYKSINSW